VQVETWVRRKTLFGGDRRPNQCTLPPTEHDIPIR
jgi:hypothetical protein